MEQGSLALGCRCMLSLFDIYFQHILKYKKNQNKNVMCAPSRPSCFQSRSKDNRFFNVTRVKRQS
jgi:hypothetical protein